MSHNPTGSTGSRNLFLPLSEHDALKSPPLTSPGLKSPGFMSPGLKSPMGFFSNRNGSSTSVNEMPPPPQTPTGIRAQIGHLLPRHAYFRAKIVIHQISSVPFVGGEFGVRWKFKGVQATPGAKQGLLGRVKARADNKRTNSNDQKSLEEVMSAGRQAGGSHVAVFSPGGTRTEADGGDSMHTTPVPPPLASRTNTQSSVASSVNSNATSSTHLSTEWGQTTTSTPSATPLSNSGSTTPDTLIPGPFTAARGMTSFLPLKDHSVVWSQTLETVLKFDIDRETSHIMQNPLKLVVMQRVIPGDPHGNPQNPRLGAVYLNLAEYVKQGSVERRYLLKESKTNATLKLTVELEHLSGETHYIAPPLAKGEILNGIAGFLEKDAVKKRPRALDLYGPYKNQEELETDILVGPKSTARVPKTARSERKVSENTFNTETETEDETTSFEDPQEDMGVAFDVQRLPVAYGTKTTEMLIEALFNPVKVSDKAEENPFTIYEPPSPQSQSNSPRDRGITPKFDNHQTVSPSRGVGLGLSKHPSDFNTATIGRRQNSLSKDESSSVSTTSDSDHSHGSSSVHRHGRSKDTTSLTGGNGFPRINARSTPEGRVVVDTHHVRASEDSSSSVGGVRGWFKRNRSRPGTPTAKVSRA